MKGYRPPKMNYKSPNYRPYKPTQAELKAMARAAAEAEEEHQEKIAEEKTSYPHLIELINQREYYRKTFNTGLAIICYGSPILLIIAFVLVEPQFGLMRFARLAGFICGTVLGSILILRIALWFIIENKKKLQKVASTQIAGSRSVSKKFQTEASTQIGESRGVSKNPEHLKKFLEHTMHAGGAAAMGDKTLMDKYIEQARIHHKSHIADYSKTNSKEETSKENGRCNSYYDRIGSIFDGSYRPTKGSELVCESRDEAKSLPPEEIMEKLAYKEAGEVNLEKITPRKIIYTSSDLFQLILNNDAHKVLEALDLGVDPNEPDKIISIGNSHRYPLTEAISLGRIDIVEMLISRGAKMEIPAFCTSPHNKSKYNIGSPLFIAYVYRNLDVLKLLLQKGADPNYTFSFESNILQTSPPTMEKSWPTLAQAIIDKENVYIETLLTAGASPNTCFTYIMDRKYLVKDTTPFLTAVEEGNFDLVNRLLEAGANVNHRNSNGFTSLMQASRYSLNLIKLLVTKGAKVNDQDGRGYTVLDHAKSHRNGEIISFLEKQLDAGHSSCEKISLTEEFLEQSLKKTLSGMQNVQRILKLLSIDYIDFINGQDSKIKIFWGSSGTGKTEMLQRIAGLRSGFPGMPLSNGSINYFTGVDGNIDIKAMVDNAKPYSIMIIDEADKCFDENAGMITKPNAIQIQHSFLTHLPRKPLYWILAGTFHNLRNGQTLNFEMINKSFGIELGSRLDFAHWKFHDWNLESILRAAKTSLAKRGHDYDEDAILLLSKLALKMGGGPRTLENFDLALSRQMKLKGKTKVTMSEAKEYINSMGIKVA